MRILTLAGVMDISRYPAFRETFENVHPGEPVVLDLAQVESVDSTFLMELMLLVRRIKDTPLAVVIANDQVIRILAITDLTNRIAIYPTLAEARAALGG